MVSLRGGREQQLGCLSPNSPSLRWEKGTQSSSWWRNSSRTALFQPSGLLNQMHLRQKVNFKKGTQGFNFFFFFTEMFGDWLGECLGDRPVDCNRPVGDQWCRWRDRLEKDFKALWHGLCMCSTQRVNGYEKIFKCLWTRYGSRCQAHRFVSRTATLLGFSSSIVSPCVKNGLPP